MNDYYVIDAHVHTYKTPEIGLQAQSGNGKAGCFGTPDELLGIMKEAGIAQAVQVNMTPARSMYNAACAKFPEGPKESDLNEILEMISGRVRRRNEWTIQMAKEYPALVPFPSVDPLMGKEAMVEELLDKIDIFKAPGLKIHPAEGCFFPNDRVLWPVYQVCQDREIPVLSHGGAGFNESDESYARPMNFKDVLKDFPKLTLVIAHLGGDRFEESVEIAKEFPNLYFDTSATIHGAGGKQRMSDEKAVDLIRKIGTDRVMFGSDFPWFHPGQDLKRFLGLKFTEEERKALLADNAKRILKL